MNSQYLNLEDLERCMTKWIEKEAGLLSKIPKEVKQLFSQNNFTTLSSLSKEEAFILLLKVINNQRFMKELDITAVYDESDILQGAYLQKGDGRKLCEIMYKYLYFYNLLDLEEKSSVELVFGSPDGNIPDTFCVREKPKN